MVTVHSSIKRIKRLNDIYECPSSRRSASRISCPKPGGVRPYHSRNTRNDRELYSCKRDAKFTVVGLDPNWFGSTTRGKLKTLLCGLCELCVALPDVLPNVEAVARQDSITYVG